MTRYRVSVDSGTRTRSPPAHAATHNKTGSRGPTNTARLTRPGSLGPVRAARLMRPGSGGPAHAYDNAIFHSARTQAHRRAFSERRAPASAVCPSPLHPAPRPRPSAPCTPSPPAPRPSTPRAAAAGSSAQARGMCLPSRYPSPYSSQYPSQYTGQYPSRCPSRYPSQYPSPVYPSSYSSPIRVHIRVPIRACAARACAGAGHRLPSSPSPLFRSDSARSRGRRPASNPSARGRTPALACPPELPPPPPPQRHAFAAARPCARRVGDTELEKL